MSRFWEKWKNWEQWPFWMRYFLITPHWFWYCLKSRSLWFFTPANPTLSFGGFEGEPKSEMYAQLPPSSYPKTLFLEPGIAFHDVLQKVREAGFEFPFIVKPDVGMSGILFRKMENEEQLRTYHQHMPVKYMVQELVSYPIEYSVFYYRYPDQQKGVITGFLQKEPMHVIGNGKDTLLELITKHPKAKFRKEELFGWHRSRLNDIIANGNKYYLTLAANLNRGGNFVNLRKEIDEQLHDVFDALNLYSKHFYYGRYDLKAASLSDLKQGRHFSILEYNGSGAEPNHVYNSGYSLKEAHKEILMHWRVLYEISKYNAKRGFPYWPLFKGWRFLQKAKKHFKLLNKVDNII